MTTSIPRKNKTGKNKKLRFDILSIFPKAFFSYFEESLIKRAKAKGILEIGVHNIRDFSNDRHSKVDDRPFGGGPGMVMKVEPIYRALLKLQKNKAGKERVILFSTRGKKFDAATAKRLSKYDRIFLICGRYEGVDERVAEKLADEEISMGDYVLSGGELPAMILVEAVSRFLPGFLGKYESLEEVNGSFPTYTRPEEFQPKKGRKWVVPKVLLSGNHADIEAWRERKKPAGS
jgi:tRNA (guanine37-N1)-methyltransferase